MSGALAETVGPRDALVHIMTGRTFDGPKAAQIGLVNASVPRAPARRGRGAGPRVARHGNPAVLRSAKVGFKQALGMSWEQAEDYFSAKLDQSRLPDAEGGRQTGLTQFLDAHRAAAAARAEP